MFYKGIGIYSGALCEALELCCVIFKGSDDNDIWNHEVIASDRIFYDEEMAEKISNASKLSGLELIQLHTDYGHMIGNEVNEFMQKFNLKGIQFVSCHGHTIIHKPNDSITFQIGDGETLAAHLTCVAITNFRTKDIALRGQGGSIMRMGEAHLFGEYNLFIDLAGFCHFSTEDVAFTVCPCNILLKYICRSLHLEFDVNEIQRIAMNGNIDFDLLNELNEIDYYSLEPPKWVENDWFESDVIPILGKYKHLSGKDVMRTAVEHITEQISMTVKKFTESNENDPVRVEKTALINGQGAYNTFLMEQLKQKLEQYSLCLTIMDVDSNTVIYKECIIIGFIGLRTLLNLHNIDEHITGASFAHIAGSIHLPPNGIPSALFDTDQYAFSIRRRTSSATQLQIPNMIKPESLENPPLLKKALAHRSSWPVERPAELVSLIKESSGH